MGLFSKCDHEWVQHREERGLINKRDHFWHKCTKCGKKGDCDQAGRQTLTANHHMVNCSVCDGEVYNG